MKRREDRKRCRETTGILATPIISFSFWQTQIENNKFEGKNKIGKTIKRCAKEIYHSVLKANRCWKQGPRRSKTVLRSTYDSNPAKNLFPGSHSLTLCFPCTTSGYQQLRKGALNIFPLDVLKPFMTLGTFLKGENSLKLAKTGPKWEKKMTFFFLICQFKTTDWTDFHII